MTKKITCKLCGSPDTAFVQEVTKKPSVEVDYGIKPDQYFRTVHQCHNCGVYFNNHNLLSLDAFYDGDYNRAIDEKGLMRRFNKIINLPKNESDNVQRVSRILKHWKRIGKESHKANVLDVGSGTCVFLYELKKYVNETYCIDPDQAAVDHAKSVVGVVGAHRGSIMNFQTDEKFDLIAFNKVLEHVLDPVQNLSVAGKFLKGDGRVYIELPESDRIVREKIIENRAEFAIEHITIFNTQSLEYLATAAGYHLEKSEIITDPSGKFTIYGFLTKKRNG